MYLQSRVYVIQADVLVNELRLWLLVTFIFELLDFLRAGDERHHLHVRLLNVGFIKSSEERR